MRKNNLRMTLIYRAKDEMLDITEDESSLPDGAAG